MTAETKDRKLFEYTIPWRCKYCETDQAWTGMLNTMTVRVLKCEKCKKDFELFVNYEPDEFGVRKWDSKK